MKRNIVISLCWLIISIPLSGQVIDTRKKGTPFSHYWSMGVCAGRANEALRASWLDHLKTVKKHCGFRYVRMHGLFCDDMFVYSENKNGEAIYNWQYVDEVYDRLLDLDVKPFVELSFFPKDIAADNSMTQMWYRNNVSADRNKYYKWEGLVRNFVRHIVDRYGIDEVRSWYFEVWNEPNLSNGFFDGTKSDYFELYKISSRAIKSIDSRLKVGGPATSNFVADDRHAGERIDDNKSKLYSQDEINKQKWEGVWIEEFLRFCEKENLPVDFVSTHPYPTDYALDPKEGLCKDAVRYVHSLKDDILWLRNVISKSKYSDVEIHLTEWSTSPNSRDRMHDILPPAAYIIKGCLDCIGLANSLMYWTFTDIFEEKGGGMEIFHGGFGMINFQGCVKPSFHAYRMLNELGDEVLYYSDPLFVSRSSETGKISAVAFNYPKEFEDAVPSSKDFDTYMNASSKEINFTLTGLSPHTPYVIETLDKEHGNVYDDYVEIGKPHSPDKEQMAYLKERAWNTLKETVLADEQGRIVINRVLRPWTCVLIKEL